ncbi:MAG: family 43 glycosylhydrolase [Thermoclostridium sp.]|nr:family 43 glycosylhydrolase [Thermoclostridium sp.]
MINSQHAAKGSILVYTRTPVPKLYSSHLAYSVHMAYSKDGDHYEALNQNYGILFVKSTVAPDNTLNEKGLKKPYLFLLANGGFGIVAVRINADGSRDEESKGKAVLWISRDLFHFNEVGLLCLHQDAYIQEVVCEYDHTEKTYVLKWKDEQESSFQNTIKDIHNPDSVSDAAKGVMLPYKTAPNAPEGAVKGNVLEVDTRFGTELFQKWSPLVNVDIIVPELVKTASTDELNTVTASAVYSDGSIAEKQVIWQSEGIDFSKPGIYEITGTVTQDAYPFPLAVGYADPDVIQWCGKYYFIATNDNTDDIGLYVREADTISGLFEDGVKEYLILDRNEEKGFVQTFWAPEFHVIAEELYILFAVGGRVWGPQSHLMRLKKGGSIIRPDDWEEPVRIVKKDGTWLASEAITLDMTYFHTGFSHYLVWSYREHIGTQKDSGSMLYVATIDPKQPWQLTSAPVLLSRPLYGWENNEHTINNEGPYAIVTDDKVYLTYSGGAAGGYSYVLGLLTAKTEDDLLNPQNWIKSNAPVLSYYSVKGEYGPGHNTFFKDRHGNLMIAYHAQDTMDRSPRCTAVRRVHFNREGIPVFDMSAERDISIELAKVKMKIEVVE